jgi:hypothetical protein
MLIFFRKSREFHLLYKVASGETRLKMASVLILACVSLGQD